MLKLANQASPTMAVIRPVPSHSGQAPPSIRPDPPQDGQMASPVWASPGADSSPARTREGSGLAGCMGIGIPQSIKVLVGDGVGFHRRGALLVGIADVVQVAGELQVDVVVGPTHGPLAGRVVAHIIVVALHVVAGLAVEPNLVDIIVDFTSLGHAAGQVVILVVGLGGVGFQRDDLVVVELLADQGVLIVVVAGGVGDIQDVGQFLERAHVAAVLEVLVVLVEDLGAVLPVPAAVHIADHARFSLLEGQDQAGRHSSLMGPDSEPIFGAQLDAIAARRGASSSDGGGGPRTWRSL